MGMYSSFNNETITITNWEGLVQFLELWKKEFPESEYDDEQYPMLNKENKTFSFENWNDWKIISYWYNDMVVFLNCVANYIQGSVYWDFENQDESGWVEFTDGKCIIHTGQTEWGENTPAMMFRETESLFEGDPLNKHEKLKKFLLLGSL